MKVYVGMDLHATNTYVGMVDAENKVRETASREARINVTRESDPVASPQIVGMNDWNKTRYPTSRHTREFDFLISFGYKSNALYEWNEETARARNVQHACVT